MKIKKSKSKGNYDFFKLSMEDKGSLIQKFLIEILGDNDQEKEEVVSKIPVKKEKIDFPKLIKKQCEESSNVFILTMDKNYAFLIKRKDESVIRTLCPGTMNPVEQQKEITFYDSFAIWWKFKNNKIIPNKIEELSDHGFRFYHVESEYDVISAINEF